MQTNPQGTVAETIEQLGFSKHTTADQLALLVSCPNLFAPQRALHCDHSLSVGQGWMPLLTKLSYKLEEMIVRLPEDEHEHFYATQVKEKYGGLRFYMRSETDEMTKAIRDAEAESFRTCEKCGARGEMTHSHSGWMLTLCRDLQCRPPNQFPLPKKGPVPDVPEPVDD